MKWSQIVFEVKFKRNYQFFCHKILILNEFFCLVFMLILIFQLQARSEENNLYSGLPITDKNTLNIDSFVAFEANRVRNAKLVWFNESYFKEHKLSVPLVKDDSLNSKNYSEELQKWALDNWAYMVKTSNLPPDFFTEKTKTFYADFYGGSGGDGINGDPDSLGSGRAASSGAFNIKGIGRTPLASSDSPEVVASRGPQKGIYKKIKHYFSAGHHLHGGSSLREAMMEAVWGELLNQELPHGANRVVAIISVPAGIGYLNEPRALIVRENSIRPAHFMRTPGGYKKNAEKETRRITQLLSNLMNYLDVDISKANRGEVFKEKLMLMTKRMAETFATEYAHSIFHGATSPSNIEISGKALDHGPLTTLDGFTRATYADVSGNGDVYSLLDELILEFVNEIRNTLPQDVVMMIPKDSEIRKLAALTYNKHRYKEILWRAGLPRFLAERYSDSQEYEEFAKILLKMAQKGNESYKSVRARVPRKSSVYDLGKILQLSHAANKNPLELNNAIKNSIKDNSFRAEFVEAYLNFFNELIEVTARDGVEKKSLEKYLATASQWRNKSRTELFRGLGLLLRQYKSIFNSKSEGSTSVQEFVDRMIEANIIDDKNNSKYSALINSRYDKKLRSYIHEYYDAEKDQHFIRGNNNDNVRRHSVRISNMCLQNYL